MLVCFELLALAERSDSPVRFVFALGSKRLSWLYFQRLEFASVFENETNRSRLLFKRPRHDDLVCKQKTVLLGFVLVEPSHNQSFGNLLVRLEADWIVDLHFVAVLARAGFGLRFLLFFKLKNFSHLGEYTV